MSRLWPSVRGLSLSGRFWGLVASRPFTRSGWVTCTRGFPKVRVKNRGGTVEVGSCLFFPGVRLEVGHEAAVRERVAR